MATERWKRFRAWTGGRGVSRRIAESASSSHCRATDCGGRVVEVVKLVNVVVVGAGGRGRHWHRASHWLVAPQPAPSHCSPAPGSTTPSPQTERRAVNGRRLGEPRRATGKRPRGRGDGFFAITGVATARARAAIETVRLGDLISMSFSDGA